MQGEFEKKIQKKVQDFRLKPSSHVWEEVATILTKENKRSYFTNRKFYFLFIMLAVTGFWFFSSEINHPATTGQMIAKRQLLQEESAPAAGDKVNNAVIPLTDEGKEEKINFDANTNAKKAEKKEPKPASSVLTVASHPFNPGHYRVETPLPFVINQPKKRKDYSTYNPASLLNAESIIPTTDEHTTTILPGSLHLLNHISAVEKPALSPGLATISDSKITSSRKSENKRPTWNLLIGTGATNTTDKNAFLQKTDNLVYLPRPTFNNPNPVPDTSKYMRKAFSGYHLTVGIQYNHKLAKHWMLYSGLQYTYASNRQKTGKKNFIPTPISLSEDTTFTNSKAYIKVPYHYLDAISTTADNSLVNYAHWLEVPLSLGYVINPEANTKIEIRTGAVLDWMFAYKWLIPDGRYSKFYYSNQLTNNLLINWHADANFTLKNQMQVGMRMKHSFNTLAKKPVQPSLYWNNFSLYGTIPLKF